MSDLLALLLPAPAVTPGGMAPPPIGYAHSRDASATDSARAFAAALAQALMPAAGMAEAAAVMAGGTPRLASDAPPTSRSLEALLPDFRIPLERVIERVRQELGYEVRILETYRTPARQHELFEQGRSTPGPVVTWTRNSLHMEGRAADLQLVGAGADSDAYRRLGEIAAEEGLRTLGPRDPGHIELSRTAAAPATDASAPAAYAARNASERIMAIAHAAGRVVPRAEDVAAYVRELAHEALSSPRPPVAMPAAQATVAGTMTMTEVAPQPAARTSPAELHAVPDASAVGRQPLPVTPAADLNSVPRTSPAELQAVPGAFAGESQSVPRAFAGESQSVPRASAANEAPEAASGPATSPATPLPESASAATIASPAREYAAVDSRSMHGMPVEVVASAEGKARAGAVRVEQAMPEAGARVPLAPTGGIRESAPTERESGGSTRAVARAAAQPAVTLQPIAAAQEATVQGDAARQDAARGDAVQREAVPAEAAQSAAVHGDVPGDVAPPPLQSVTGDSSGTGSAAAMPPAAEQNTGSPAVRAAAEVVPGTVTPELAQRIDRVMALAEVQAARPVHSLLLRLDEPDAAIAQIRVGVRGNEVSAALDVADAQLANVLRSDLPELQRALERHGLETLGPEMLRVTGGAIAEQVSGTARGAQAGDRDASESPFNQPHGGGRQPQQRWRGQQRQNEEQP